MSAIQHRPFGAEHPYALSPDQRIPVLPLDGQSCSLGVLAADEVGQIACEWEESSADGQCSTRSIAMTRACVDQADAAALAGGEGHLADAQAAAFSSGPAWTASTPPVRRGSRYRYRFVSLSADGTTETTTWFSVQAAEWTMPPAGVLEVDTERLVAGSVSWLVSETGVHAARFALRLSPGDHVVGFGERFDHLDQAGRRLDTMVFEQYKAQGVHGRTYLPMPFAHVVSADGSSWGFHLRTSRRAWYDVAASAPGELRIEVALGGTDREVLEVATYAGSPGQVLSSFLDEVGRAEELPEWVFSLWASGNEWNTQALVMEQMDLHREFDVPVGVCVIEAWSDEEGITIWRDACYEVNSDGSAHGATDFSYPADGAWPDPKAMIDELHARGIKVILWQIPLQKTDRELTGQVRADADAMIREQHVVREADGSPYHNRGWWFPQALMPDLTTQRTRDWWTAKREYLVRDFDVDGFKTDGGEHAWGHDLRYGDGTRGDVSNNLFPVHYARAFGDLLRSAGKAPITFSRAGFTGSQAHGVHWAGDEDSTWEAFRHSVTAGLTASSCGIVYWGWDMAGFSGPIPEPELYLRAAAASCFMPIMQYHSEFNHHHRPLRDRTPWNIAELTGDALVVPFFREIARERERLRPYLVEQARHSIATGAPLMRPLFFDHVDDAQSWNWPYQWKLGDDLLVAAVIEPGQSEWTTYLPSGTWADYWTGERLDGGQAVTRECPLGQTPVYRRIAD